MLALLCTLYHAIIGTCMARYLAYTNINTCVCVDKHVPFLHYLSRHNSTHRHCVTGPQNGDAVSASKQKDRATRRQSK